MKNSQLFVRYLKEKNIYDEVRADFVSYRTHTGNVLTFEQYLETSDAVYRTPASMLDQAFTWAHVNKDKYYSDIYHELTRFNFRKYLLSLNKNLTVL